MVEGAPHTAKERSVDQLVCYGVPLPPYIKEGGGGAAGPRGAPGGVVLLPGVGRPPLALLEKEGGREKEERGAPPPFLVLFGLGGRGARPYPGRLSSLPLRPTMAH